MGTVSIGELQARIAGEFTRLQNSQQEKFDSTALQWLALVPEWTDTLARAAGFPVEDEDIEEFVGRAADAQLCQLSRNLNTAQEAKIRFSMGGAERRRLIAQWIEQGVDIRALAMDVAHSILRAVGQDVDVALGVERWARLTLAELDESRPAGDALTDLILELVNEGELAETPTWLYAGEALEAPLGAEMTSAVRRARRRLKLHDRTERDRRLLEHFLEREEQLSALDRLIGKPSDDQEQWALHFLGRGGVGKTMLMRFLTGPYADEHAKLSAARVDFDHVDPRYPTERPGALLEELADGLSIYVEDRTRERYLRSLRSAIERANTVAKGTPPVGDALAPMHTHEFTQAIAAFASFAGSLASPLLLILDTCEELAKLHPAGENVPSIDATFEIFERIHELAPSVRVVFAGRRPLTPRAANWSISEDEPQPPSVMSLKERPYLNVEEVLGFDREEARRYLFDVRGLAPEEDLFEAILRASCETVHIVKEPDSHTLEQKKHRFNPFDIARYGDWIEADPGLRADLLATDWVNAVDPYVLVRIVGRLGDEPEMLEALSFATVLGRFEAALLHAVLSGDTKQRQRTVMALAEQEWIGLEGGSTISDMVLAVEPGLLQRLRRYFEDSGRARELDLARRQLRPILRTALREEELALLSAEQVDAALRVLPPKEATEGFDKLTQRVTDAQAWAWAEHTCGRLLAIDREEQIPQEVQASVRALYAATLYHRGSAFNGASLWTTVQQQAAAHPDPKATAVLEARAALGGFAAALDGGVSTDSDGGASAVALQRVLELFQPDNPVLVPALLRLAEAVLDVAEACGDMTMSAHVETIAKHLNLDHTGDPTLDSFACMLLGRAHALAGRIRLARPLLSRATQMALRIAEQSVPAPQRYADWLVPASPRHRLLLEQLRHELAAALEPAKLLDRCQRAALSPPHSVDEERLLSLVVRARLAQRPLDNQLLEQIRELEESLAPPHATAPAHRAVSPLFVSLSEALLAGGRAGEALHLLTEREAAAVGARDEETVRMSALAILRVLRRLRLDERLGQARELAVADHPDIRAEGLATTALIAGDEPRLSSNPGPSHAERRTWTPMHYGQVLKWHELVESDADRRIRTSEPQTPEQRAAEALDRVELVQVLQRWGISESLEPAMIRAERAIEELLRLRRGRPNPRDPLRVEISRLALRAQTLEVPSQLKLDETRRSRANGELALEEGELLALRLPEKAIGLLDRAELRLAEGGDRAGAFIAALRKAIAQIHAGDNQGARESRPKVESRQADALLASARRDSSEPAFDPWRGWIERVNAYLAWYDGSQEERSYTPAVELRMEALPGIPEPKRMTLDMFVERKLSTSLSLVRAALSAALLIPVMLALGASLIIAAAAGAAGLLLMAFDAIPGARLLTLATRAMTLNVDIVPAPGREQGDEQALLVISPDGPAWLQRRPVRLLWSAAGLDRPIAISLDEEPFRPLPRRLVTVLGTHATTARRNVRLIVTPDVALQPWEARLVDNRPLQNGRWSPRHSPTIWRRTRTPHRRNAHEAWSEEGISVIASHEMQPFVRHALSASRVEVRSVGDARRKASPWGRAVLMVGTPVATASGWQLRLSDDRIDAEHDLVTSAPETPDESFVAPERGCTMAPFVIVQVPPGGENPELDRRTADGLRGFANEAAASGAYAVLAIPSLPSQLAQMILGAFAEDLSGGWKHPPSVRSMTALTTHLRTVVWEYGESLHKREVAARSIRAQVAYDICLYIPDDAI
jgi:hypothetical protein